MHYTFTFFRTLIISMLLINSSLSAQTPPEKGVSSALAKARKENIKELTYSLHLDIPEDSTADIKGTQKIEFVYSGKKQDLALDFKEATNHLHKIRVNGKVIACRLVNEHIIIPKEALQEGSNTLNLNFIAGNTPLTRRKEYLYTLLVPERTRMFIPCFDQPDLKARFALSAKIPACWDMLSNGNQLEQHIKGGEKYVKFALSDKISTYLFSIVAGKFSKESRQVDGRTMNFWYRETDKDKIKESIDNIFELHRESLRFLEEYTGIKYPFSKFDFVALADLAYGGMEHVGAIDYKASSLFLDKDADQRQRMNRINLIAHETSHMWFGNLVTMKWFNDVWMKEVFANFMADKVSARLVPGYKNQLSFMMAHNPAAYAIDRTEGSHPVRQQLDNLNNAASLYGSIIYHKAPIAMNQLELLIGKDKLQEALRNYLKHFAGSNADWNDLIGIIKSGGAADIVSWNDTWINGANRPTLSYALQEHAGKITRFVISQQDPSGGEKTWGQHFELALIYPDTVRIVPVDIQSGNQVMGQLEGMPAPEFVVFNAGGEGYGLFPFDTKMLNNLSDVKDDLMRSSAYINLYENVLEGKILSATDFVNHVSAYLEHEKNDLLISQMTSGLYTMYWQFMLPQQREQVAPLLEQRMLGLIEKTTSVSIKKKLFKTFTGIAVTAQSTAAMLRYWKTGQGPAGLKLNEEDLTALACNLALRQHPATDSILNQQENNISNADRKNRFRYIRPALSRDQQGRDRFFYSLKSDRKNESYLVDALAYLHHPLRLGASEKYLQASLEWLPAVKASSGIFFPTDWLSSTFGLYQSAYAEDVVRTFLKKHPDFDPALRLKILQQCDNLFRARKHLQRLQIEYRQADHIRSTVSDPYPI